MAKLITRVVQRVQDSVYFGVRALWDSGHIAW